MKHLAPALAVLALLWSPPARATTYVPRERLVEIPGEPARPPARVLRPTLQTDAMAQLARLVEFERMMQYSTTCTPGPSCDFGGQIEVESGPGNAIRESDNTQEAIWDWSFYRQLTGQSTYDTQVANGFGYLMTFPGYNEWMDGGGSGPDYYSFYNCGWGVRAILQYEAATADTSHHGYGDLCAAHIRDNVPTQTIVDTVDAATFGWAASGLWQWADAAGDAALKQTAVDIGAQVKAWLDASTARPAIREWAVTGGAAFYGVVNSYMKAHPDELVPWVTQIVPHLGGWIDESTPASPNDWTDWRNAHAAWNMLAQFTASEALGAAGDPSLQVALDIYGRLVLQDSEMDGGIPGSQQRPPTEDESWITSYLAYFGIQKVLALPPPMPDAGAPDAPPAMPDAGVDASGGGSGGAGGNPGGGGGGGGCAVAPGVSGAGGVLVILGVLLARAGRPRRSARRSRPSRSR